MMTTDTAAGTEKGDKRSPSAIHWFRNGLRFHDNACLHDACLESDTLLPLYVIDPGAPFAQTAGRRAGCIRANFALESMREIDKQLREEMNSRLVVIVGSPEKVVPEVAAIMSSEGPTALYYEKDYAAPVRESDAAVLRATQDRLRKDGKDPLKMLQIRGYETQTLHPMEKYASKCKGSVAPSTYGGFTKIFQRMEVPDEVETVTSVPPLPRDRLLDRLREKFDCSLDVPTLADLGYDGVEDALKNRKKGGIDFDGGEEAGLALLDKMMSRSRWVASFEKPNTSPNALVVDTTGLSPCASAVFVDYWNEGRSCHLCDRA